MWRVTLEARPVICEEGHSSEERNHMTSTDAEAAELLHALAPAIEGEVAADATSRAVFSTDASNYRHLPIAVVAPRSADDVLTALRMCAERGLPVLPRGAGTSIGGQAANTAVVLDFTRHLNRVRDLDPERRVAVVEPGLVLDHLRRAAAPHGLTFGPDPSTHSRCTLGGMIGNNACGSHSLAWGKTSDNIRTLRVALRDGTVLTAGPGTPDTKSGPERVARLYRDLHALMDGHLSDLRTGLPGLNRRVSGYNLDALLPENGFDLARALVGSEGTLATTLEAEVVLQPAPAARALAVLGFPDEFAAADAVPELLDLPALTMESIDEQLVRALTGRRPGTAATALPDGTAWLYLEVGGGDPDEAEKLARLVADRAPRVGASSLVVTDPAHQRALWRIREEGAGLATRLDDGSEAWSGWEDAAVPPERLGSYLRGFRDLMHRHGRRGVVYGHFGEGCLHVRIDFPFPAPGSGDRYREFLTEAAELVVRHGGSLSGEHGDGQARSELLPLMYPQGVLDAFREYKAAFDPDNGLNPGRIVDPAPMDADLRTLVAPPRIPTRARLALHADDGDLAAASRRCVGVGKCVADSGGVMCPSYRASGREEHSTRGRARLLFEMLNGEVIKDGWRSEDVAESLDLCLGCKACSTDCPVNVDMATYKVEFLSRHYQGRIRPAAHYAMGGLPRWARLGAPVAGLANRMMSGAFASVIKRLGGITPERDLPPLATPTFQRWFKRRTADAKNAGAPVVLWPDTFTNYFEPGIGRDAVAVLERLGYQVRLPERSVCCGLTWYSTGQLRTARAKLRRTLDVLEPWLDEGVPVVGLEPSCTAMLRSGAAELLPDDERVPLLAKAVRTFAEVLADEDELPVAPGPRPETLSQVHCHQYAELGYQADSAVLAKLGGGATVLDGGCCGLAGDFGFTRGHYAISVAAAEHELLPALRAADEGTDVHADGFSCRLQIRQLSGREPVHLATLAARAFDADISGT
jgi:FAD/FMN-containing dehydrogenase/Fe-S oxidoreductase